MVLFCEGTVEFEVLPVEFRYKINQILLKVIIFEIIFGSKYR
jgi:hypothetical protein